MRTELSDDLHNALDVGARVAEVGDAGPERYAAVYGVFDKWPVPQTGATAAPPPPAARRDLPLKPPRELAVAVNTVATEIGAPPMVPTDTDGATNPEELFALGYGACFLSALSLVAGSQKMSSKAFAVDAKVAIGQEDDGGFGLAVDLHGILPGVVGEKAAELMRAAHTICPYSKATRGNLDVAPFVGDEPVHA